jgi:myxalamid-type nonribosomal peptide synthetase MxaA
VWQREWMSGETLEKHVSFWITVLSDLPPVFARLTDLPGELAGLGPMDLRPVAFGEDTTSRLKALAQERDATLFMVLVTLFHVVVRERSGLDDILSVTYGAGRLRHELNDVIGCFASLLPVRTRLAGELTFGAALERVRGALLDVQAHQGLPFEKLGELAPQLNLTNARRILILLDDAPLPAAEMADLRLESPAEDAVLSSGPAMLRLMMREAGGALSGHLSFSPHLLSPASIHRLGRQLEAAAAVVAADPEIPLNEIGSNLKAIDLQERLRQESELEDVGAGRLRHRRRARAVGVLQ